jgi:hypothetical protein
MIVKFFKYGSGDGTGVFNYLLNHRVEDKTSRVLRGSPDITLSIIQSLTTKKRYKSGCLSFEESDISQQQKEEIMDLFEKTIFPSISNKNMNICWIEHTDKGRVELNFVIPRVELSTYKAFNPYFHRIDKKRFELFRDYINKRYNFTNPNDPNKEQTLKLGDMKKYSKHKHIKMLDEYLLDLINNEKISNREELIEELKLLGYIITRVNKDYISIKTNKSSKAFRLKGKYYKENWENKIEDTSNARELYTRLLDEIKKSSIYIQSNFYNNTIKDVSKSKTSINKNEILVSNTNILKR